MTLGDRLDAMLTAEAKKRLDAGEWRVIGLAGDQALAPIAHFLKQFDIDETNGVAIVIVRKDGTP